MKRTLMHWLTISALASGLLTALPAFSADQKYVVEAVAQKKINELPAGPLYWRVETFSTLTDAKAAVGPDGWNPATVRHEPTMALIAEVVGRVWVVTLGPKGASTPGGTHVAEIGPLPPIAAPEYMLRLNHGSGPAGSRTPVHSHPGSESFYVINGRLGQKTSGGVSYVDAGQSISGHPSGTTMEVFNAGATDLNALIMFVVDASKPFSVPAKFE